MYSSLVVSALRSSITPESLDFIGASSFPAEPVIRLITEHFEASPLGQPLKFTGGVS